MITLKEYIFYKYKGTTIAIAQDETTAFGVPYPLETGWFMENSENRLSEEDMLKLYAVVYWKSKRMSGKRMGEPSNVATYATKTMTALVDLFGDEGLFDFIPVNPNPPLVKEVEPLTKRQARKAQLKVKKIKPKKFAYEKIKPVLKVKQKRTKQPSVPNVAHVISKCSVDVTSDAFLSTFEWKALRMQALTLHGAKCQCCGATPSNGAVMNVDHVKPRKFYPELALKLDNLQILCHDCNHGKGNWDETDWRIMSN